MDLDVPNAGHMSAHDMVQHVRFTLADVCIRTEADKFSFFRILNRCVFLSQRPITFAIGRFHENGREAEITRTSVGDPMFKKEIAAGLSAIGISSKGAFPVENLSRHAIRVFSTRYFLLVFEVIAVGSKTNKRQSITYTPLGVSSELGLLFCEIFAPFGITLRALGVDNHLNTYLEALFDSSSVVTAKQDRPVALSSLEKAEIATAANRVNQLLEREVDKIIRSPLILPPKAKVSNLFLVTKRFDLETIRFGKYYYNICVCLHPFQKHQFTSAFPEIKERSLIPFPDASAHKWFWEKVRGQEWPEIWYVLEKPMSTAGRPFPEYVLMSGASIVNSNPFLKGDIGWVSDGGDNSAKIMELRRFSVIHFLLQMMYDGDPLTSHPSLLTIPLRVAGATWIAATTVVEGSKSNAQTVVGSDEFQRRFLVYHSIMRDFEGRVRRKAKQVYIDSICDLFLRTVRERAMELHGVERTGRHVELGDAQLAVLAERTYALCRVFPFDPVLFSEIGFLGKRYGLDAVKIGETCAVEIGVQPLNPYFDRFQLRSFLKPTDLEGQIRRAINAEFAHQLWKRGAIKPVVSVCRST